MAQRMRTRGGVPTRPGSVVYLPAAQQAPRRENPIFADLMDDIGLPGKTPLTLFKKNDRDQLRLPQEWRERAAGEVESDLDECRRRYEQS